MPGSMKVLPSRIVADTEGRHRGGERFGRGHGEAERTVAVGELAVGSHRDHRLEEQSRLLGEGHLRQQVLHALSNRA